MNYEYELQPEFFVRRKRLASIARNLNKNRILNEEITPANAVQMGVEDLFTEYMYNIASAAVAALTPESEDFEENMPYHHIIQEYNRFVQMVGTGDFSEVNSWLIFRGRKHSEGSTPGDLVLRDKYYELSDMISRNRNDQFIILVDPEMNPVVRFNEKVLSKGKDSVDN